MGGQEDADHSKPSLKSGVLVLQQHLEISAGSGLYDARCCTSTQRGTGPVPPEGRMIILHHLLDGELRETK